MTETPHAWVRYAPEIETFDPQFDELLEEVERLSPFLTVGRIHIPPQDVSGMNGENVERTDALAFNQWRVTAEHAPLGEIMHVRKVYTTSARVRRELNHQTQTEPTSPAAALR
ncbi:MAG: hypothetical protein JO023_29860 [Chloroflexi bacterium]|nr:hypothetical protein [Chloroflexota bacterium]